MGSSRHKQGKRSRGRRTGLPKLRLRSALWRSDRFVVPRSATPFLWPPEPRGASLEDVAELLPEPDPPAPGEDARQRALEQGLKLQKARKRGTIAGIAVMLVGLAFSAWTGRHIAWDRAALGWPEVQGKVTVSQKTLVSRSPDRYQTHFIYEYPAQGRFFTSRRVRFAGGQGDPTEQHRAGDKVKVRVDPTDPRRAVLSPGVSRWGWIQLLFGVVVAGLGAVYVALSRRGR